MIYKGSRAVRCIISCGGGTILCTVTFEISHVSSYFSLSYDVSYIISGLHLLELGF